MNSSANQRCLDEEELKLSVSELETFFFGMIVPFLIVFGISGNIVNLSVLLDRKMRTRSNTLLASLAVTDVFFLVFMIPHSMAHYRAFAHSYYFRLIYMSNKLHLIAILNWTSACAIWLILAVSMERLVAIRYPFYSRDRPILMKPSRMVSIIVFITGLLTFYNHFSYHCETRLFCNGTQSHSFCIHQDSNKWFRPNQHNPNPLWFRLFVRWSPLVHAVFVIFIPILLVCISNTLLIVTIKRRQHPLLKATVEQASQQKLEQKVARTVTLIVSSFTITQGPSAVLTVISTLRPDYVGVVGLTLTTFFVVLGKSLTFVLFCTSSASFRQRLLHKTKLMRRETVRKLTVLTQGDTSTVETLMLSSRSSGRQSKRSPIQL